MEKSPALPPRMISSIQACRGIAAIAVLLFHNSVAIFSQEKYWSEKPFGRIFDFGHAGVEFFFVLSGFIILRAHWIDLGNRAVALRYILKRLWRIYPIYWLILLTIMPVFFLDKSFGSGHQRDATQILSSIFLLEIRWDPDLSADLPLSVSWTLFHEMLFYIIFSSLIVNIRAGLIILSLWFFSSIYELFNKSNSILYFYFSPLNVLFLFGMLTYWTARSAKIKTAGPTMMLGMAIFCGAGIEEVYHPLIGDMGRSMVYGGASALILAGLVQLESAGRLRLWKMFTVLGDASYSIYLTHLPLLSALAKISIRLGLREGAPPKLMFVATAITATSIGVAIHLVVEKPLLQLSGRWLHVRRVAGSVRVSSPP